MPIFGVGSDEKNYSQISAELFALNAQADSLDAPNEYPFLHMAIIYNNLQGLRAVIDYYRVRCRPYNPGGKNTFQEAINLTDKDGNTALHLACSRSNLGLVKVLMEEAKADDKLANAENNLALHLAVQRSKPEIVEYLLTKRHLNFLLNLLRLNSDDESSNPDNNYQEAKFNAVNNDGFTPLFMALSLPANDLAAEKNKEKIIIALLDKYSQIQFNEDSTNAQLINSNYLFIAIQKKLSLAVIAKIIQKIPLRLNAKNADGLTALHLAVMAKDKALVELLLENNVMPFETNNSDQTALHLAAERQYIDADILELLLDYYKEHGKIHPVDSKGKIAFHIAASHCDENIARLFIDYGANVNAKDLAGNTPFHRVALAVTQTRNNDDSVKHQHTYFYLYHYADRTIRNEAGESASDIFEHYLNTPLDTELTVVDLDDSHHHDPNTTDGTNNTIVTSRNSYLLMASKLTSASTALSIDATDLAIPTPTSSARSEGDKSAKPLLPIRVLNNSKGLLEKLNNYRISLWRKFKATAIGRFVRRHPYISAAIFTVALTGFVALCVFAAPVAAKIAILSGVKIALTKMKILSASSHLLDPIAKTVAMVLPTIGVAIIGGAIKLAKYCYSCFTQSKVATNVNLSVGNISPQHKHGRSPEPPRLQNNNDNKHIAVLMPKAKTTSFSIRDYLPACLFSCFDDCNRQRISRADQYEVITGKEKERQKEAAVPSGDTVDNPTLPTSDSLRVAL